MAERMSLATSGEDLNLIVSYLDGYRSMLVIAAACRMELFDKVNQSPEGVTAAKLAEDNEWDEDSTHRVLNSCVALKTLNKSTGKDGKEMYQLAGSGRLLQKHADPTVWDIPTSWTKKMLAALSKLPEEVRIEKNKEEATPSLSSANNSTQGQQSGDQLEELLTRLRSMGGYMKPYLKDLLKAFDLSKFLTAVELGAGSGAMTFELCRQYPSMSATYFDTAQMASTVQEHLMPKEKLKVNFKTGSFLEDDLPTADLYFVPRNLYNYSTEQLNSLFKKVFDATNSGGAIVLLGKIMNDAKDGPVFAHVKDMIILSHNGGKLRSGAEFTAMLQAAGYTGVKIAVTSEFCPYDVMIATKP